MGDSLLLPRSPTECDPVEALRERRGAGLTVAELARRLRVGEDKIRGWIRRGELRAINVAMSPCGKPRWVVSPESLAEFERRRTSSPPPPPKRRRKKTTEIDYYPD